MGGRLTFPVTGPVPPSIGSWGTDPGILRFGAADIPPVYPPSASGFWVFGPQITISVGANDRVLNGSGSDSLGIDADWDSEENGGHRSASFRILESERTGNPLVYRHGARVVLKCPPGEADAGATLWTGYLLTPVPDEDGVTSLMRCGGYQQLVREREDPLLWQTAHTGDWSSTDDDPFGGNFRNTEAIEESVGAARLAFKVSKSQVIEDDDTSRVAWWFPDHTVTRVAGTIRKNSATSNYILRLRRYSGPTGFASGTNVENYATELASGHVLDDFITDVGGSDPMVAFELERDGTPGGGETTAAFKVWITDVRVSGDAFQEGRNPDDNYTVNKPILDMAFLLGFSAGGVEFNVRNCLPLWHQSGPWADLFDRLAASVGGLNEWKWGVWDIVDGAPEIDFSNWDTNNTTWVTKAYTAAATARAKIDAVTQDVYSKAVVSYRLVHSPRLRRAVALVDPNPFAGLDSWMEDRARIYRYHLDEPQRANNSGDSTLAQSIADALADAIGQEQYSGTIQAAFLSSDGVNHPALRARAGDRVTISDFPGGPRTFRVQRVAASAGAITVITVGDKPRDLKGVIKYQMKLAKQKRIHSLHV